MGRKKSTSVSDSAELTTTPGNTKISNFGQEYVQPGDNNKYLSHNLAVMRMPPIDNSDPEQVKRRISDYFQLCADNDMKPSVKGLTNALKIGRTTLWEWRNAVCRPGSHQAIVLEAYDTLEALWLDYMQNGKINPVSGIFLGKNLFPDYTDKQEYVVTPNTKAAQIDPATLEEKYADVIDAEE
jgi:hypothetical protein